MGRDRSSGAGGWSGWCPQQQDARGRDVFVGRNAELAVLRAAAGDAAAGRARVVLVTGECGTGKSALLRAFVGEIDGPLVLWVSGDEGEASLPWGVLSQLATALAGRGAPVSGDIADPAAGHAARGAGTLAEHLAPDADPLFVGSAVLQVIGAAGPAVVVVDDAHWLDTRSGAAIRFALRRLTVEPVLWVLAFGATSPEEIDAGWRRLADGEQGILLPLAGLPAPDLLALAPMLGRPGLSPAAAALLWTHTGGNPLFARTLVEQLPARAWSATAETLPAPRGMAAAVAEQLARCRPPARALVEATAVLGSPVAADVALAVAGVAGAAAERAVDGAVGAGLLSAVPVSGLVELSFPHPLVRNAVYEVTSPDRRRRFHRAAADAAPGAAALAHRVASARAPDEALAADLERYGVEDLAAGRAAPAARRLRQAVTLSASAPDRHRRVLHAVEALLVSGDVPAAATFAGEVVALAADPWVDYVAGYQALVSGDIAGATARLGRASDALASGKGPPGAPADLAVRVASQQAVMALVMLDRHGMEAFGAAATAAASPAGWVAAFGWLARVLGLALAGRAGTALGELADRPHLLEPGAPSGPDVLAARGIVRLWSDDLDGAVDDLAEVVRRACAGEPLRVAQALGFLSEAHYRAGRVEQAVLHAELAVADAGEHDRVWDLPMLHAQACYPLAVRGDVAGARRHAAESRRWAELVGAPAGRAFAAAAAAAVADASENLQALLVAGEELDAVLDAPETGVNPFGPVHAEALARLGRADQAEVALRAFEEAHPVPRRSTAMVVERVRGLVAASRSAWDEAAGRFARASAAAADLGRPIDAGRSDMFLGRCHLVRGRRRAAADTLGAAAARFDGAGAWALARLARADLQQAGLAPSQADGVLECLTVSEAAVARLAADRLTNAEIAVRLLVSVKTVEHHLTHTYAKLGVSSRRGLRALVHGPG